MNIREALLTEHSKAQTMRIVQYIGSDPSRFEELMSLFLNEQYRISQRAAWSVSYVAEENPELIAPYLEQMIKNLQKEYTHDAVKRNTVRILKDIELPESFLGLTADICFNFIATPSVPVATKVYSMRVLYNICVKEPDLKGELQMLIEDMMPHETAAFVSAGKDILKKLKKL